MRKNELRALGLVVLVFAVAAMKEPRMLQPTAINSLLLWIPLLLSIAVGQMFVIATRGIDVSVGSAVGVAAISTGLIMKSHPDMGLPVATAIAMLIGGIVGMANGALIAYASIPPIIATLGSLSVFRGLGLIISGGTQVNASDLPNSIIVPAQQGPIHLGGVTVPWLLCISLVVAAIGYVLAAHTVWGRNIFAIGSNPDGAHLRGIPYRRTIFAAYLLCGLTAGLAGMMYITKFGFINANTAGSGMELSVVAAAVIGGTDIRGGRGSIPGVIFGTLLLGVMNVALPILGISPDWQLLVYGVTILVSLLLSRGDHR